MGQVPYGPMLALQQARHEAVCTGTAADTLFLLEHAPTVTLGRNSGDDHILVSDAELRRRGVDFFVTGRGGDVTYHGPGQIVGYPILALDEAERDVKRYVFLLEEILIRTAADFGVQATRQEGLRGIWVGDNKLAAIGVRLARWVTMHGFALNVSCDLQAFDLIVPCGLHGRGVTSLCQLTDTAVSVSEVQDALVKHSATVLQRIPCAAAPSPLPTHPPASEAPQGIAPPPPTEHRSSTP